MELKILVLITSLMCFSYSFSSVLEQKIQGSITVKNLNPSDFPSAAKLNFREAIDAASKTVSGHMISGALEEEDGFLVYAIKIASNGSGTHEVLIDAGTGKVLSDQQKILRARMFDKENEDSENDQD